MSSGNLVDEGTFGTIVAMAILRKVQQAGAHCRQRGRLAVQPVRLGQRHRLHLGARPVIVAPQVQQLANLFDREAEVARINVTSRRTTGAVIQSASDPPYLLPTKPIERSRKLGVPRTSIRKSQLP